ncbi:SRPBCC family protein [Streptomyces sp. NBC_01235]|uniref:SRPBCC family protein n=1 Tax=Streptomyces sp. NBC_01235 TaxID=2903788 RepID=UPI002E0FAF43|nr:SRPBCC family protein [Streptomyces sp. NBC_01235]
MRSGPSGRTKRRIALRYAEGPRVRCDVHVAADPSRVWGLVADIGLPARLSPELPRAEWLDGAEVPARGARCAGCNRRRTVGEWWTVSYVVRTPRSPGPPEEADQGLSGCSGRRRSSVPDQRR